MSAAWQRSEGKNPKGGLNAKGRASYKAETGGTLKPPVKAGDNPRRASFLARMGNMPGPMEKDGKPTRLALATLPCGGHLFSFFAVFADSRNAFAVGAPGSPGLRIRSPEPALMRSCLSRMFAYRPAFLIRRC